MHRKSLFSKILVFMIASCLLSGAVILGASIREQTISIENSLIDESILLAKIAARSIEIGYLSGEWPFETLRQISDHESVAFLWVVKPDGEIYVADKSGMWGKRIADKDIGGNVVVVRDTTLPNTSEKIKLVIYPLNIKEGDGYWNVYLGIYLKSVAVARDRMIVGSMVYSTMAVVFAILLSFYFAGYITRPVRELTGACDRFSRGDFSRGIEIKTNDELEDLAEAFNRMTKSVEISFEMVKKEVLGEGKKYVSEDIGAYNELAMAIIKSVTNTVGPVAIMLANQISGLTASSYKVTVEGDPERVIGELINTYSRVVGPVAITLARRGAGPVLEKNKGLKVPKELM